MCLCQCPLLTCSSPSTHHEVGSRLEHSPVTIFAINKDEQATLEPRKEGEWSETSAPPNVVIQSINPIFYIFIAI